MDLSFIINIRDPSIALDWLLEMLQGTLDMICPKHLVKMSNEDQNYITPEVNLLHTQKYKMKKKYKNTGRIDN